jgi:PAS domain S-box-containing protein
MLDYSPSDLVGRRTVSFVYGPDRPALQALIEGMAKGADNDTLQHRAVHKDGHLVWVEARCRLVRDAAGIQCNGIGLGGSLEGVDCAVLRQAGGGQGERNNEAD